MRLPRWRALALPRTLALAWAAIVAATAMGCDTASCTAAPTASHARLASFTSSSLAPAPMAYVYNTSVSLPFHVRAMAVNSAFSTVLATTSNINDTTIRLYSLRFNRELPYMDYRADCSRWPGVVCSAINVSVLVSDLADGAVLYDRYNGALLRLARNSTWLWYQSMPIFSAMTVDSTRSLLVVVTTSAMMQFNLTDGSVVHARLEFAGSGNVVCNQRSGNYLIVGATSNTVTEYSGVDFTRLKTYPTISPIDQPINLLFDMYDTWIFQSKLANGSDASKVCLYYPSLNDGVSCLTSVMSLQPQLNAIGLTHEGNIVALGSDTSTLLFISPSQPIVFSSSSAGTQPQRPSSTGGDGGGGGAVSDSTSHALSVGIITVIVIGDLALVAAVIALIVYWRRRRALRNRSDALPLQPMIEGADATERPRAATVAPLSPLSPLSRRYDPPTNTYKPSSKPPLLKPSHSQTLSHYAHPAHLYAASLPPLFPPPPSSFCVAPAESLALPSAYAASVTPIVGHDQRVYQAPTPRPY